MSVQLNIEGFTVGHFEKKNLKSLPFNTETITPTYFWLMYRRKKVTLKSNLFHEYAIQGVDVNKHRKELVELEAYYIETILRARMVKSNEFDFNTFKSDYRTLSKNIVPIIENSLTEKILDYAREEMKLENLVKFIETSQLKSVFRILLLFEELQKLIKSRVVEDIDKYLYHSISFIEDLFKRHQDEVSKFSKVHYFGPIYLPLIVFYNSQIVDYSIRSIAGRFGGSETRYAAIKDNLEKYKLEITNCSTIF